MARILSNTPFIWCLKILGIYCDTHEIFSESIVYKYKARDAVVHARYTKTFCTQTLLQPIREHLVFLRIFSLADARTFSYARYEENSRIFFVHTHAKIPPVIRNMHIYIFVAYGRIYCIFMYIWRYFIVK